MLAGIRIPDANENKIVTQLNYFPVEGKTRGLMEKREYSCPKCDNKQYEVDEIRTTGGAFAKIFDVQNKKFMVISCTQCGYSELYKRTTSTFGNVVDFFTN